MAENEGTGLSGGGEQNLSIKSPEAIKSQKAIRPDYLAKSFGELHREIREGKAAHHNNRYSIDRSLCHECDKERYVCYKFVRFGCYGAGREAKSDGSMPEKVLP